MAKKPKRGRPVKHKAPQRIPDSAENVIKSMFRTRSKAERDDLNRKADKAASS